MTVQKWKSQKKKIFELLWREKVVNGVDGIARERYLYASLALQSYKSSVIYFINFFSDLPASQWGQVSNAFHN